MLAAATATLSIVLAYLLGSIPTGYLIPRWIRGIDIRQHGSGNIGATNVGRVMGLRYFVLVMVIDMIKGFVPTYFFPVLACRVSGVGWPELPVLTGAAAIVGHNFPVTLHFRGGKGVATSLGAVLALDPIAGVAAGVGFVVVLVVTRIVSISSILGGACFLGAYLTRVASPWDRDHAALTGVLLLLFVLLVVRHRTNLVRLWRGTEPRIPVRRGSKLGEASQARRSGRVRLVVVIGVLLFSGVAGLLGWSVWPEESGPIRCGPYLVEQVSRFGTGRQRAGEVLFLKEGTRLVVAAPRYNRALFLDVMASGELSLLREVSLEGRPVAMASRGDSVLILQRPISDARHLEEGYWEVYSSEGERIGSRVRVGWDPDDLALSEDGNRVFVLLSGHAEGETGRPDPSLLILEADGVGGGFERRGEVSFVREGDDPEDLILSATGKYAAITLVGRNEVAALDVSEPTRPVEIGRQPLLDREVPSLSMAAEGDPILMPVCTERETIVVEDGEGCVLVSTLPNGSALEVVDAKSRRLMGQVPIRWSRGWKEVRPTGLAYAPERGLLAVANRAGGIHIFRIIRSEQEGPERVAGAVEGVEHR